MFNLPGANSTSTTAYCACLEQIWTMSNWFKVLLSDSRVTVFSLNKTIPFLDGFHSLQVLLPSGSIGEKRWTSFKSSRQVLNISILIRMFNVVSLFSSTSCRNAFATWSPWKLKLWMAVKLPHGRFCIGKATGEIPDKRFIFLTMPSCRKWSSDLIVIFYWLLCITRRGARTQGSTMDHAPVCDCEKNIRCVMAQICKLPVLLEIVIVVSTPRRLLSDNSTSQKIKRQSSLEHDLFPLQVVTSCGELWVIAWDRNTLIS